ncbi:hypothetical protein BH09VER1_BH09VER1_26300 [soil metagenome]
MAKSLGFRGFLLGLFGFLSLQAGSLACGLRLTEPKSHFDGVDSLGHVNLVEKLGQLDAGKFKLPIFLVFNSGVTRVSPYVGASFDLPLLSSRMEATDENTFKFYEPDGWYQTFWRDSKDPTLLNGGSGWKAEIKGDVITAWANCGGSKATFVKGKITELEIDGKKFNYVYNGNQVAEIRVDGAPVLKVQTNANTGEITGLSLGMNDTVTFVQDKKPKIQTVSGKNLVTAVENSLGGVVLADGTKKSFEFAVDDQVRPTLLINNLKKVTWDPGTLQIIKADDWSYDVKPINDSLANAQISRTNSKGQKESWIRDATKGEEITHMSDGTTLRRTWFTSGALYGKPRSSSKMLDGKEYSSSSWSYDEKGRVLRLEERKKDRVSMTVYKYLESQDVTERYLNGDLREINVYNTSGRLTKGYYPQGKTIDFTFVNGVVKPMALSYKGDSLEKIQSAIDAQIKELNAKKISQSGN